MVNVEEDVLLLNKVILAPMVRGSDLAFRQMIRKYGIQHCYSPMLRAAEVIDSYNVWMQEVEHQQDQSTMTIGNDTLKKVRHEDGILFLTDICQLFHHPQRKHPKNDTTTNLLTVQLCGGCPKELYQAVKIVLQMKDEYPTEERLIGIDLNLGCPQKCAKDGGFGAYLQPPSMAASCISSMKRAINDHTTKNIRLSCKIRLLDSLEDTIAFSKQLVQAGCDIIALHCRHRSDIQHNSPPDLMTAQKVIQALSPIPIIINGTEYNTITLSRIKHILQQTKAHSIMIARDFLINPYRLVPSSSNHNHDPEHLAAVYLEHCKKYPPPSYLYIQKHLRWIFRPYLQQQQQIDYNDWKVRLWTFLVRPYIQSIFQFQQFVLLYIKLNGSMNNIPPSLQHQPEPSFQSIRHHREPPVIQTIKNQYYDTNFSFDNEHDNIITNDNEMENASEML